MRGSIVDVYPVHGRRPGAHRPLGRRGRSSHRVLPGRPARDRDLAEVEIFGCRELLPTDEVRARAEALVATQPWGREQWERLAEGQTFDGMESWLPWLVDDADDLAAVLFDLVDDEPRSSSSSRGACATAPRTSWPRRTTWPAPSPGPGGRATATRASLGCTSTSTGCWCAPPPRPGRSPTPPRARRGHGRRVGWNPVVGRRRRPHPPARRAPRRRRTGWSSPPTASVRPIGWCGLLGDQGVTLELDVDGDAADLGRPGRARRGRPARAGVPPPGRQAGRARRGRRHRSSPRPSAGQAAQGGGAGLLRRPEGRGPRRAPPARRGSVRRHGEARHRREPSATTCCWSTGATTSSTCRPIRSTRSGTTRAGIRPA